MVIVVVDVVVVVVVVRFLVFLLHSRVLERTYLRSLPRTERAAHLGWPLAPLRPLLSFAPTT